MRVPATDNGADQTGGAAMNVSCISEANNQRRLRILSCASREFLGKGFDAANLDDIAAAAGVGKATIYRHFNHKSDLFISCALDAVNFAFGSLQETLRSNDPIDQVLTRVAQLHIERMIQPVFGGRPFYDLIRALIGMSISHWDLARRSKDIFRQNMHVPLLEYFQGKIDAGELEGDAVFLTEYFSQTVFFTNSVLLEPESAPSREDAGALAARTVNMFLRGCIPAAPKPVADRAR